MLYFVCLFVFNSFSVYPWIVIHLRLLMIIFGVFNLFLYSFKGVSYDHYQSKMILLMLSEKTVILVHFCILFRPFGFHSSKHSNILTLSVPDEGYSRNASCALNLISTFIWVTNVQNHMISTDVHPYSLLKNVYFYINF